MQTQPAWAMPRTPGPMSSPQPVTTSAAFGGWTSGSPSTAPRCSTPRTIRGTPHCMSSRSMTARRCAAAMPRSSRRRSSRAPARWWTPASLLWRSRLASAIPARRPADRSDPLDRALLPPRASEHRVRRDARGCGAGGGRRPDWLGRLRRLPRPHPDPDYPELIVPMCDGFAAHAAGPAERSPRNGWLSLFRAQPASAAAPRSRRSSPRRWLMRWSPPVSTSRPALSRASPRPAAAAERATAAGGAGPYNRPRGRPLRALDVATQAPVIYLRWMSSTRWCNALARRRRCRRRRAGGDAEVGAARRAALKVAATTGHARPPSRWSPEPLRTSTLSRPAW